MSSMSASRLVALALAVLTAMPACAAAQEFPNKAITLMVGFAPNGAGDRFARVLGNALAGTLGQPVIILNRPDAAGAAAATSVKASPPDGYTLIFAAAWTYTVEPQIEALSYTLADFRHIASLAESQDAFVSLPGKPWTDFKSMVAHTKQSGTDHKYASPTLPERLLLGMIARREGIKLTPVPMKDAASVTPDALGSIVDFGYASSPHSPHVRAGKMIVLAGVGPERLIAFPALPTLKELGYDLALSNDFVLSAPRGVPLPVVRRLEEAAEAAVKHPSVIELVAGRLELKPVFKRGADLERAHATEAEAFKALMASARR